VAGWTGGGVAGWANLPVAGSYPGGQGPLDAADGVEVEGGQAAVEVDGAGEVEVGGQPAVEAEVLLEEVGE